MYYADNHADYSLYIAGPDIGTCIIASIGHQVASLKPTGGNTRTLAANKLDENGSAWGLARRAITDILQVRIKFFR